MPGASNSRHSRPAKLQRAICRIGRSIDFLSPIPAVEEIYNCYRWMMRRPKALRKQPLDGRAPTENGGRQRWSRLLRCRSLALQTGPKSPIWETTMAAIKILATAFFVLASSAALADDPLPRAKPE